MTTDSLGSTRVITASDQSIRSRSDYLPFGEEIGAFGTGRSGAGAAAGYSLSTDIHQKFTSKERDTESSLDYFGARYLSSPQGRFTGADPLNAGADNEDPQSWNGYAYGRNNPLIYVDESGRYYDLYDKKGHYLGRVQDATELANLGYNFTGSNQNGTRLYFKAGKNEYYADYVEGDAGTGTTSYATDMTALALSTLDELARSAKGTEHLIAGFGIGTAVAGAGGGLGLFYVTSTGAVGGLTTLGLSEGAETTAETAIDANKLFHIFAKAEHNLQKLVTQFGSRENAFRALQKATEAAVKNQGLRGVFETTVRVGAENVTVRGAVVNGVVKIGTAFIP